LSPNLAWAEAAFARTSEEPAFFLTPIFDLQDGASRMSPEQIRVEPTLLSELALTLVGTFAVGLSMAVAIIWICS
jgi:hypothetical protein